MKGCAQVKNSSSAAEEAREQQNIGDQVVSGQSVCNIDRMPTSERIEPGALKLFFVWVESLTPLKVRRYVASEN